MNLPKICQSGIGATRKVIQGYGSNVTGTRNAIPKCHDCVHFKYGFPTYSKNNMDFSYGKCNRVYTLTSEKLAVEDRNLVETYFSPPAVMAREHSELCGTEG